MTQPDREHHLANKVQMQWLEVSITILASDRGTGSYISDVVNLGALRSTIALPDLNELGGPEEMLRQLFYSAIRLGQASVVLFDERSERFAAEMNSLTEKFAAAREKDNAGDRESGTSGDTDNSAGAST